jgi:two-component system response regulator
MHWQEERRMYLSPILVVEDNPDDWFFLQRAFRKTDPRPTILWSQNGAEAIDSLTEMNGRNEMPALILTDIKMPVMDGLKFLERIQANPAFRAIPAGVISSSNQRSDVQEAYRLGAKFYIVKPSEFLDLLTIAQVIAQLDEKSDFDFSNVSQFIPRNAIAPDDVRTPN